MTFILAADASQLESGGVGNPANYSLELPSRCLLLLEQLWMHAETVFVPGARELGPLTSTFLISLSMPVINLPIERLERHRGTDEENYANDRPIAPAVVKQIDRDLGGAPFRSAPFFKEGAWSFVQCSQQPLPNIARGLPPGVADELASEIAMRRAALMPTSQWCGILRNALAHGGIAYLDEDGKSSYGRPIKMYAFASGKYLQPDAPGPKPLSAVNILRVSQADYFTFLRNWVAWLQQAGIEHAMAS